jgi:hypothetical protein
VFDAGKLCSEALKVETSYLFRFITTKYKNVFQLWI